MNVTRWPAGAGGGRVAIVASLGALLLGEAAGCRAPARSIIWHDEAGYRWRALSVPAWGGPGFSLSGIFISSFAC